MKELTQVELTHIDRLIQNEELTARRNVRQQMDRIEDIETSLVDARSRLEQLTSIHKEIVDELQYREVDVLEDKSIFSLTRSNLRNVLTNSIEND